MKASSLMHEEAASAPQRVQNFLKTQAGAIEHAAIDSRKAHPQLFLTNARGSSDHAGVFSKYNIMTRLKCPVVSASPSIASIYGTSLSLPRAIGLSISQSGQSPDILATARDLQQAGSIGIAFTNDAQSPLAGVSNHVIDLCAGPEKSVAATKTFIASMVGLLAFVSACEDETDLEFTALPDALETAWNVDWSSPLQQLAEFDGLYVIGRGPTYGIAREAALKFKETCQLHAEAYSSAECAHGPMALIGPRFPALIFAQQDQSYESTVQLARRLVELGAPVFIAGARIEGAVELPVPSVSSAFQPICMITSFYRAVADLALAIGKDPDAPPALQKVTRTV